MISFSLPTKYFFICILFVRKLLIQIRQNAYFLFCFKNKNWWCGQFQQIWYRCIYNNPSIWLYVNILNSVTKSPAITLASWKMSIRTVGGVLWGFIYENTIKHEKIFKFPRKYLLLYNRTEFTAICRMTIMSDAMTHYGHPPITWKESVSAYNSSSRRRYKYIVCWIM